MKLEPSKTAYLTLDYQMGIFGFLPAAEAILPLAARAVDAARKKGFHLVHVGLGFRPGWPEIPDVDFPFRRVKQAKLFEVGSDSAAIHPSIALPGEDVLYKQRVGAFTDNALQMVLRAKGGDTLVLSGISTSGVVLSTVRRAFDMDFRIGVIKDACMDPDPEVHRVLTEKVFPSQATVLTADAFISELG